MLQNEVSVYLEKRYQA